MLKIISATAIDRIKQKAKKIAKERNIPHTVALEASAKEAGYTDYQHVIQCRKYTEAKEINEKSSH